MYLLLLLVIFTFNQNTMFTGMPLMHLLQINLTGHYFIDNFGFEKDRVHYCNNLF